MRKLLLPLLAMLVLAGCSNSGSGELVGVETTSWSEPNPYGMVFIKQGSFTMGLNDQDASWAASTQSKVVSIDAFWMDETEITNREYKQFVYWVRDSIAREKIITYVVLNSLSRVSSTTSYMSVLFSYLTLSPISNAVCLIFSPF